MKDALGGHMKFLTSIPISFLSLGLLMTGCSTDKAATPMSQPSSSTAAATSSPDQDFINNAAKGNRAEVELGHMMATKATNRDVKQFAQQMVKDHTDALNQLQQLAQSKSLTLADGLPSDAEDLQQKLSKDHGIQADKDYVKGMVEDHQKDVKDFQDASQNAKDPDVKQWAGKTLPTLQEHLQKIQALDSKINKVHGT
jgi:putative membrane protein